MKHQRKVLAEKIWEVYTRLQDGEGSYDIGGSWQQCTPDFRAGRFRHCLEEQPVWPRRHTWDPLPLAAIVDRLGDVHHRFEREHRRCTESLRCPLRAEMRTLLLMARALVTEEKGLSFA